jgi:long-chain acyl-CoA synthetase
MKLDFFQEFQENLVRIPERLMFKQISASGEETLTYGQVGEEIRAISLYLRDQGISKGDPIGILMGNHPRWGIAFLAGQSAGAVLVPLDVLHSPETLASLIDFAECKALFCSGQLLESLTEIQQRLHQPLPVIIVGQNDSAYPSWDDILTEYANRPVKLPLVIKDLEEPHVIMYTSGTTGIPKGVVLSGRNLYQNVVEALKSIEVTAEDNFLNVLPLYHILSLIVNFIAPLYVGSRVTFLDVLDAQRILKAFRDEGISIFVCVPQFYYVLHRRLFQRVEQQSFWRRRLFWVLFRICRVVARRSEINLGKTLLSSVHRPFGNRLRFFGVGGARFDPQVIADFKSLGFNVLQAYGMTETGAIATMASGTRHDLGSVGKALPHVEIKIDRPDAEGRGEVLIRGGNVMQGYLKNPKATRETIDLEGWLHTGDLGYLTPEGYLHITGRRKDVIVLSSGKNIYPEEIEHYYQTRCPLIKELCVIGLAEAGSEATHEKLHGVVVPDFDRIKQEQVANLYDMLRYLIETIGQSLPAHKRVRSFEIRRDPLPRTTTRKIKRFEVVAQRATFSSTPEFSDKLWEPENDVEREIRDQIQSIKEHPVIRPDLNLELDLGFESLERVEFLSNIQETLNIDISDEEAATLYTVEDVINLAQERLAETSGVPKRISKSWADILSEPLSVEDKTALHKRLRRRFFVEILFILVAKLTWVLSKLLFRLKGRGMEHLPTEYPFMICPNHLSFVDAFVVVALLPSRVVRRFFSLGYSSYFDKGIVAFLGTLIKTIPVDADRSLRQALRLAAEGIRMDLVLCVFPEGERSIDGKLKTFRKGPAILATEFGLSVVPVGIRGSYEVWKRGSGRIRLNPIRIFFGEPIRPQEGESAEEFNARLREAVADLVE